MVARLLGRWLWTILLLLGDGSLFGCLSEALETRQSSLTTRSTFLVIAKDESSSYSAYSGLNDYGIPYETLLVTASNVALPILNATATEGNYGGIVVLSNPSLSTAQWNLLYAYQVSFGVRMVLLEATPSSATGTRMLGSCCATGQEQTISINDTSRFTTAGLIKGAALSTIGLYHYPAAVTDSSKATAFVQFGVASGFSSTGSVGGVINDFSGRQQMVFFIDFATAWSLTSSVLTHAWIHWATRGIYPGYRRLILSTQVDDVFLTSPVYYPSGTTFRVRPADLTAHVSWMSSLNAKLPAGSNFTIELGHNGNGNIATSYSLNPSACPQGPISYVSQAATELEYVKPRGTGSNLWPASTSTGGYSYSLNCAKVDPLETFFAVAANRDAFSHVSHTFTHLSQNNATYFDVAREISWNQAWLAQVGLASAKRFSPKGIIPPAITGLHNGDALQAWKDFGIGNAVGDNTRPILLNTENEHWPLITTADGDGFAGMQVIPRWAENIYFNMQCDTAACDVKEWNDIYDNTGTIADLLAQEKETNVRHLLALRHDPHMFHQANLRQTDVDNTVVNGVSGKYSLLQMWVETVALEVARIVTWPIISLKHDDIATAFSNRMTRDSCNYVLSYIQDAATRTIKGVIVTTRDGNSCSVPVPVTVPGTVLNNPGFATEQIGNDPLTVWVVLSGDPVMLALGTAVAW
ncbi:hypothetical protein B0O99DRAFT_184431 [Bisporella sp. PMI_857]|nr:hypothetical protein B0O99DRAFT_184431 [Bisporella sp. PMI_857]